MEPITAIAEKAGIPDKYLEQYGKYKAKIDYNFLKKSQNKDGKLILVTAINPTPAGEGKTTTVAGPSGVGKSSLINCLQENVNMETGSISRKIERGKHTTRHSELIPIDEDSYIMDTPGFSSLYTNDFGKEELKYYFPEFDQYQGGCRFQGCNHISEPGCLVKEALEEGKVHQVRYEDYCEMYRELEQKEKRRY